MLKKQGDRLGVIWEYKRTGAHSLRVEFYPWASSAPFRHLAIKGAILNLGHGVSTREKMYFFFRRLNN